LKTHETGSEKAFHITVLLYLILAVLGMGTYVMYSSYAKTKNDEKIMYAVGLIEGTQNGTDNQKQNMKSALDVLKNWTAANAETDVYAGLRTLEEDFDSVAECVNQKLENGSAGTSCHETVHDFAANVSAMVSLRQSGLINSFGFMIAIITVVVMALIYAVRIYIDYQIRKHAIVDHDTKLFNRKYFDAHVKKACAEAKRYERSLTVLVLCMKNLEKLPGKKARADMLGVLGLVVNDTVRLSDIASRYNERTVVMILNETDAEGAEILETRLLKALGDDVALKHSELEYVTEIIECKKQEESAAFIAEIGKRAAAC